MNHPVPTGAAGPFQFDAFAAAKRIPRRLKTLCFFVRRDSGGIVLVLRLRPGARLRLTPLEVFPQGGLQTRLAPGLGTGRLWFRSVRHAR
jgi:hypothetical protein